MRLTRYGRIVLIKFFSVLFLVILIIWYFVHRNKSESGSSYFDTHCIEYNQKDYSKRLNDKIVDYSAAARLNGVTPSRNDKELHDKISEGKLVKVRSRGGYVVDKMTYSYPCLTPNGKDLLEEISDRLRDKVSKKGLKGVKIIVTSMTRKTESLKNLRRNNQNASLNSPHQYGNAFDISYRRFIVNKWVLTNCDKKYLKDALGEIIWQLCEENKCWATYERSQSCYHVVAR